MASLARIYLHLIWARVRGQLQYRASFLLEVAGAFCLSFGDFLVILVIFHHLPFLAGWSLAEVAFLYGSSYVTFKLTDMAVGHLDGLPQLIQRGDFDLVLIRPLGSLFQMLASDLSLRHVGSSLQGLLIFAVALRGVEIDWTLGRLLVLLVMPVSGAAIFAGIWVVGAASTFWTVRTMEVLNAFTYGGSELASYPMHIYGDWLRRLFAYVVPLAFVNYFPALYILDKPDPLGAPAALRFASPLVAAAVLLVGRLAWGFGVRYYRSTGS